MNPTMIDIVFIVFITVMVLFGYIKGFITRLYDFMTTILVLYISFFFSKPLNSVIRIYDYNNDNAIVNMAGDIINQIIVFIILFLGLFIAKKIIGLLIKPLLKGIVDKFSLTKLTDKLLGVVLSLIEAFLISYFAFLLLMTPIYPTGTEMINNSLFVKEFINVVPSLTTKVQVLSDGLIEMSESHSSGENVVKVMLIAYEMGMINEQQVSDIMRDSIEIELNKKGISLSSEEYKVFEDILINSGYNNDELINILKNVNVSDE